jgi:superfamily II DNA or RNA helicase
MRENIQKQALEAVKDQHRAGLGISMGVGKTYIGLQHMEEQYHYGARKFLVVAPKKSIFQSWKDDAEKFNLSHLMEYVTFTTYLSLKKQPTDYDVIYLDECHSLLNSHDFYLSMYGGKILGLTGTPPRYKNSEKGKMVEKYCPIVYKYIADDAIGDEILNDYKIIVHRIPLDKRRTMRVKTKTGSFVTSEQSSYDYWTNRINQSFITPKQKQIFRVMRMKAMMEFPSKETYAKRLLEMQHEKTIVFCNTIEQADQMCEHSYHSKNKDNDDNLALFKADKIYQLSCVLQLSEGINVPNLRCGIILHSYSNERKSSQRIGRMLRLNPKDKATIHILMYENTVDEEWVTKALEDWDESKIILMDPII